MKNKNKINYLSEKVIDILSKQPKGDVLDLGCGDGGSSKKLHDLGFKVTASDIDYERFRYHDLIKFRTSDLNATLPFSDKSFDYVLFLEVIEHLYNPLFVIEQISRVLKPQGVLILSTPNILNISSRLRFLFEGSFDFFREPILDYHKEFPGGLENMHVIPWRYQELEYLLFKKGLEVSEVHTDLIKPGLRFLSYLLRPLFALQCCQKEKRALKKGGVDFRRIDKLLFSDTLLLGRHLIITAVKK